MASPSIRHLSLELKALQREPVEGFKVFLPNESDLYIWHVAIFGPPDTLYQGGYFKVRMTQRAVFTYLQSLQECACGQLALSSQPPIFIWC